MLTYGQSGSGKTFTLFGSVSKDKFQNTVIQKGILSYFIDFVQESKVFQNVQVKMFQLYLDQLYNIIDTGIRPKIINIVNKFTNMGEGIKSVEYLNTNLFPSKTLDFFEKGKTEDGKTLRIFAKNVAEIIT